MLSNKLNWPTRFKINLKNNPRKQTSFLVVFLQIVILLIGFLFLNNKIYYNINAGEADVAIFSSLGFLGFFLIAIGIGIKLQNWLSSFICAIIGILMLNIVLTLIIFLYGIDIFKLAFLVIVLAIINFSSWMILRKIFKKKESELDTSNPPEVPNWIATCSSVTWLTIIALYAILCFSIYIIIHTGLSEREKMVTLSEELFLDSSNYEKIIKSAGSSSGGNTWQFGSDKNVSREIKLLFGEAKIWLNFKSEKIESIRIQYSSLVFFFDYNAGKDFASI